MNSNVTLLQFFKPQLELVKNVAAEKRLKVQLRVEHDPVRTLSANWFLLRDGPVNVAALVTDCHQFKTDFHSYRRTTHSAKSFILSLFRTPIELSVLASLCIHVCLRTVLYPASLPVDPKFEVTDEDSITYCVAVTHLQSLQCQPLQRTESKNWVPICRKMEDVMDIPHKRHSWGLLYHLRKNNSNV